jgi:hypothetical protein
VQKVDLKIQGAPEIVSNITPFLKSSRGRLHLRFGCAVWMSVSPVECVFDVMLSVDNSKMTSKAHSTLKHTSEEHVQNVSVMGLIHLPNLLSTLQIIIPYASLKNYNSLVHLIY